ncbi:MAG: seg [Parcubacteria group bacterium]|nr:seg [Parcubacteria group bacterium]
MRQEQSDIGQNSELKKTQSHTSLAFKDDFVLEKNIFNNVFEKDIRRVYIYKKAERLAKAIHLITPAFSESVSLKERIDTLAMRLVDASLLPLSSARTLLSRELLTLSSLLSIARTSGTLSLMNVELIQREVHLLLQEVASYEEPRLSFDEVPTLSDIAKHSPKRESTVGNSSVRIRENKVSVQSKGQLKDKVETPQIKDRQEAVIAVIRQKRRASIKDISTVIRNVSEKTIQRELMALVASGTILKEGERRWSTYSLANEA